MGEESKLLTACVASPIESNLGRYVAWTTPSGDQLYKVFQLLPCNDRNVAACIFKNKLHIKAKIRVTLQPLEVWLHGTSIQILKGFPLQDPINLDIVELISSIDSSIELNVWDCQNSDTSD